MSIDTETMFYVTKGFMTLEESKKLNKDRQYLDLSLLIGMTTDDQLYEQIKVEINIFHKCHEIIYEKNSDNKQTKLMLLMLFDRINNMFAYMFFLFPVNVEYVQKYLQFCSNHLPLIFSPKFRQSK